MKKKQPTKTAPATHTHLYIKSFKAMDKPFFMTLLLDFACFITLCIGLFCFFLILNTVLTPAAYALQSIIGLFSTLPSSGEMNAVAEATLTQNFLILQWFYLKGLVLAVTTILFLFLATSVYKAHIWMHLSNKKHTAKYIFRFIYVSMIWQILWFVAAIIIFAVFTPKFVALLLILELLLYVYFTPFARMQFTEKHSLLQIYKEAVYYGVKKFKTFIIPFALMFITIVFSIWIFMIFASIVPILFLIFPLLILIIMAWGRFYFAIVAKNIGV